MIRLLFNEFEEALSDIEGDDRKGEVSLATGKLMYPYIGKMLDRVREKFPNITTNLYMIRNDFFGETITVAGLITGQDLKAQLKGQELGDRLLLPCSMLRSGEEVFLDDVTVTELSKYLNVDIDIVPSGGREFIETVIGDMEE